jgi:hypothetical protein
LTLLPGDALGPLRRVQLRLEGLPLRDGEDGLPLSQDWLALDVADDLALVDALADEAGVAEDLPGRRRDPGVASRRQGAGDVPLAADLGQRDARKELADAVADRLGPLGLQGAAVLLPAERPPCRDRPTLLGELQVLAGDPEDGVPAGLVGEGHHDAGHGDAVVRAEVEIPGDRGEKELTPSGLGPVIDADSRSRSLGCRTKRSWL